MRAYEREIETHANHSDLARRVQTRRGIGPITASALVATVGTAREFRNGRQFAAWLGLVPRPYSTGGKVRLGHIPKRGDPYVRTLLVMGARSVLQRAARESDPLSRWALALKQRRGYHRACVAVAAKNARIVWALLAQESPRAAQPPKSRRDPATEEEHQDAATSRAQQARPALAEPDQRVRGKRRLTIEAPARGFHPGQQCKTLTHRPIRVTQSVLPAPPSNARSRTRKSPRLTKRRSP